MGKFPWGEILATINIPVVLTNIIGIIAGYMSGRYRTISKNQTRRSDD